MKLLCLKKWYTNNSSNGKKYPQNEGKKFIHSKESVFFSQYETLSYFLMLKLGNEIPKKYSISKFKN